MLQAARRHIKHIDQTVWDIIREDYADKAWKAHVRECRIAFEEEALEAICARLGVGRKLPHFDRYGLTIMHSESFGGMGPIDRLCPEDRMYVINEVIERLQALVEQYRVQPALIEVVAHVGGMEAILSVDKVPVPFLAWKPSQTA